MKKIVTLVTVITLIVLFIPEVYGQCSQCKLLAEQSVKDDEILGSGGNTINTAILYIMTVPYIILAFLFRKQIARLFKK